VSLKGYWMVWSIDYRLPISLSGVGFF